MSHTDLLAKMEALREQVTSEVKFGQDERWAEHVATLTEAIAALRTQEATVRECAEICDAAAKKGGLHFGSTYCKNEILARFGLTGEKS